MKIEIPTHCPECGSRLERVNNQLFCRNTDNCPAQSSRTMEAFCKKMKLKGFGEKTLEKLEVTTVPQLFYLEQSYLVDLLGEKTGNKLADQLDNLRQGVELPTLLSALSIPLVGEVAAKKACVNAHTFQETNLTGKAGANLESWKHSARGKDIITLPWVFKESTVNTSDTNLNIAVCITGSLLEFPNRNAAVTFLESKGFTVKKSVTKDVKYLICEDETKQGSSSYLKAIANGIKIGSIAELLNTYNKE